MKKASGEVTLHLHTKKLDHMMYASWDKDCNRQWHFGPFFAFYHTNNSERQNFEKKKQKSTWRYYPLKNTYYKSRSYDVWFLKYKVQQTWIFCHFGPFPALLPPDNLKIKTLKYEENTWRYYHFTNVYNKWWSYNVWFLRYGAWQMDRHTDGQMDRLMDEWKPVIYTGGCPT